jgi:hypothetical protein
MRPWLLAFDTELLVEPKKEGGEALAEEGGTMEPVEACPDAAIAAWAAAAEGW